MLRLITFAIAIALLPVLLSSTFASALGLPTNPSPPDLSGIAWIDNDTFLAIHDAKFPEEAAAPKASLLTLPSQLGGTLVTPLNVTWPREGNPGSDLECVAQIPDQTREITRFLLGESGDNDRGSKRILLAELDNNTLIAKDTVPWPIDIYNVEGCAVTAIGDELVFIFAERAQGSSTTNISSAALQLDPLRFGPVNSVEYRAPIEDEVDSGFRPVSALEIDEKGNILTASAIDPDVDTGPFSSQVWLAGHISADQSATPPISLLDSPELLATLDGLKVEGLATRPTVNGSDIEVVIGTDDEYNGGVLRVLPRTVMGNTTVLTD
jgi:hypothetical protein